MKNKGLILCASFALSMVFGGCFLSPTEVDQPPIPLNPADSAKWGDPLRVVWKTPRTPQKYEDLHGIRTAPAIVDDKIIFAYGNIIQCFLKETGDSLWAYESKSVHFPDNAVGQSADELFVENGRLYYVSSQFAECRNVADGALLWRTNFKYLMGNRSFNRNSQSADKHFITISSPLQDYMQLLAISKSSGSVVWRVENATASDIERTGSGLGPALHHNGKVYVGSALRLTSSGGEGGISAFDAGSGTVLWKKIFPALDSTVLDFPNWREPSSNKADAPIHALNDGLILQVGESIAKLDFDGNIQWRRIVHLNGHPYTYQLVSLLDKGILYGYHQGDYTYQGANTVNNEDHRAYAYAVNTQTSDVRWKNYVLKNVERAQLESFLPQINDNILYNIANSSWLAGQETSSGNIVWSSRLDVADSDKNRIAASFSGGYRVEGNRVYFVSGKNIVCMERK